MPRRLRPASLHPRLRGPVLVPLAVFGLPERIAALGRTWHVKEEHHVTALDTPWLAERANVSLEHAWDAVTATLEGRRAGPVRIGDELREVRRGQERTLIVMARVDGFAALHDELAARLGTPLPLPPAHVTLYTGEPGEPGIGLHDEDELRALTRVLQGAEGADTRAAMRFDAVFGPPGGT